MLTGLLDGLIVTVHLLREITAQPVILADTVVDELNGHATGNLHGGLTFLTTVEPRCRPPTLTDIITIHTRDTLKVKALYVNLQVGERVYQPVF